MNLEWLIIGGGIHGVHIAARLIDEAGVDPGRIRIVDPGPRLLDRWRTCTATTGMTHLRSPSVHHLGPNPWALQRMAGKRKNNRKSGLFAPPYDRPALGFFNEHCDRVINQFGLSDLHVQARAVSLSIDCEKVDVELSNGEALESDNVVLAIGASEQPHWPDWAPRNDSRVHHVFEQNFDGWPASEEAVVVVGGGISGGQVAIRLLNEGHRVDLVSRHPMREHQFDSDPGWLGPRFMTKFKREPNADRRRALITDARHRGSMPPDVHRDLRLAIKANRLQWHQTAVDEIDATGDEIAVHLSTGSLLSAQRVLLATGFSSPRPGGSLVDHLVASESLSCAKCGYPIVDESLRWHPRVYVSGPLAELELGPSSRNIAGARRAADKLVKAARSIRIDAAQQAH